MPTTADFETLFDLTHQGPPNTGWLAASEGHHLEFKEAKQRFDFEELVRYCVVLANVPYENHPRLLAAHAKSSRYNSIGLAGRSDNGQAIG